MVDPVSKTAKCQMDCCRSLAEWYAYVAALNVHAVRAGYGLRKPTPYRTRDPVVEYGLSLGKVLFRVERGGVTVYSRFRPVSMRTTTGWRSASPSARWWSRNWRI